MGTAGADRIRGLAGRTRIDIVGGRGDDSVTADPFDVVDPKKGCPPGFCL